MTPEQLRQRRRDRKIAGRNENGVVVNPWPRSTWNNDEYKAAQHEKNQMYNQLARVTGAWYPVMTHPLKPTIWQKITRFFTRG